MSATGQGGITIINGTADQTLTPVTFVGAGGSMVFTHNLGKTAYQVIVTDANGNVLNGAAITVTQTSNAITVVSAAAGTRYISCRFQNLTQEADYVAVGDPRVVITPGT